MTRAGTRTPATVNEWVAAEPGAPCSAFNENGIRLMLRRLPTSRRPIVGAGLGAPATGHDDKDQEEARGAIAAPTAPGRKRPSAALVTPVDSLAGHTDPADFVAASRHILAVDWCSIPGHVLTRYCRPPMPPILYQTCLRSRQL